MIFKSRESSSSPEPKAQEEIVLSKSTFDSTTETKIWHRVWWLKYELPSSLSLKLLVPAALPILILLPLTIYTTLFIGQTSFSIANLLHPDYLLLLSVSFLSVILGFMGLVCAASLLYLVNPREFLNLWQLPDIIRIRNDVLEMRWTKADGKVAPLPLLVSLLTGKPARVRIPWHWIEQVHLRDYLYMGLLPQKVLESI